MAIRNFVIGEGSGPYSTGATLSSNGVDDLPNKKAWNPYSLSVESNLTANNTYPQYKPGFGPYAGHVWTDNDELKLQDKLATKVKGHEFDLGVFAGTSREVASSLVGSVSAIVSGVRSLKRGDFGGALRSLSRTVSGADRSAAKRKLQRNDVAGSWLALQYGWLPLYHDVYAAASAFESLSKAPRSEIIVVTRNKSGTYDGSQAPSVYTAPGDWEQSQRIVYTMTEDLPWARRMGLADPRSVVWELLPWSFVVDWFVPVGTYLSNLSVIPQLKGTFGRTIKKESRCKFGSVVNGGVCTYGWWWYGNGQCYYTSCIGGHHKLEFQRGALTTSLSTPTPSFKGLSALVSSSNRVANAIALLSSVIKGKR